MFLHAHSSSHPFCLAQQAKTVRGDFWRLFKMKEVDLNRWIRRRCASVCAVLCVSPFSASAGDVVKLAEVRWLLPPCANALTLLHKRRRVVVDIQRAPSQVLTQWIHGTVFTAIAQQSTWPAKSRCARESPRRAGWGLCILFDAEQAACAKAD